MIFVGGYIWEGSMIACLLIIGLPWLNKQVLYTLGGLENLQTAKKYYASTIDLTGGKNTRALFGICLVRSLPFPFLCQFMCCLCWIPYLFLTCETDSVHARSDSWQRGGTRKRRRARSWIHWQPQAWRRCTSKKLPPNYLCSLQP